MLQWSTTSPTKEGMSLLQRCFSLSASEKVLVMGEQMTSTDDRCGYRQPPYLLPYCPPRRLSRPVMRDGSGYSAFALFSLASSDRYMCTFDGRSDDYSAIRILQVPRRLIGGSCARSFLLCFLMHCCPRGFFDDERTKYCTVVHTQTFCV